MTTHLERMLVILDYDGTITYDDCNEVVLQEAVGDAWLASERAMKRGEISPGEAFRRQIALLRVPRRRLLEMAVAAARLRPGLRSFLRRVLDGGGRAVIISHGFREAIEAVWRREGLPRVEIRASELLGDPQTGYRVGFGPLALSRESCEHCKGRVLPHVRGNEERIIVFGDGDADLCLAREADVVFARRRLARLCDAEEIGYRGFDTFAGAFRDLVAAG